MNKQLNFCFLTICLLINLINVQEIAIDPISDVIGGISASVTVASYIQTLVQSSQNSQNQPSSTTINIVNHSPNNFIFYQKQSYNCILTIIPTHIPTAKSGLYQCLNDQRDFDSSISFVDTNSQTFNFHVYNQNDNTCDNAFQITENGGSTFFGSSYQGSVYFFKGQNYYYSTSISRSNHAHWVINIFSKGTTLFDIAISKGLNNTGTVSLCLSTDVILKKQKLLENNDILIS